MDIPFFNTLRIAPTTQQGGTQTIQQSIYLTHNNPCGANMLIFQEMGLTGIRYIDLKNYMDTILNSDEMVALFEDIRVKGTEYINAPDNNQLTFMYLYAIQQWAQSSIKHLPIPERYYNGYRFRINVYDASGTMLYDSYYPKITVVSYNPTENKFGYTAIKMLPSNPYYYIDKTSVYKISTNYSQVPFIDSLDFLPKTGFVVPADIIFSNFSTNQGGLPETVMAIASLLVDSANTRSFGIPKYGFSARSNLSGFGGITYNCAHFIDIRTTPDENGQTTLVESIFFRLSLEEDTFNFDLSFSENPEATSAEMKSNILSAFMRKDLESCNTHCCEYQKEITSYLQKQEEMALSSDKEKNVNLLQIEEEES